MANGDPLILGQTNESTADTILKQPSITPGSFTALEISAQIEAVRVTGKSFGVTATGGDVGVWAVATGPPPRSPYKGVGVHASAGGGNGVGVYGESASYHGVVGSGELNGVYGIGRGLWGCGVVGQSSSSARQAFGGVANGRP